MAITQTRSADETGHLTEPTDESAREQPVSTLRGASGGLETRWVGRAAVAVVLLAALVTVVVLFAAGIQKNSQVTRLRQQGVPVDVTVTHCMGLLGGSGSNGAGFTCNGVFTYRGHRHAVGIPGDTLYGPGTVLKGVVARDDPSIFSTVSTLRTERASGARFVLPSVLLAGIALSGVGWALHRRRKSRPGVPSAA